MPFLIANKAVGGEHTKFFIEIFKEEGDNLFRWAYRGRIVAIGLVVDVGTSVSVGENGEMIGGAALQVAEGHCLFAVSHVLSQVAIGNGSAIDGDGDVASGGQHQIVGR